MRHTLPSPEICGQLDIAAENLDHALAAVAEVTGASHPRGASFVNMMESAVALHHGAEGMGWTSDESEVRALQAHLDELRTTCLRAQEYIRAIETSRMFIGHITAAGADGGFDAARDAVAAATREAMRAANAFEHDWNRRKALARLREAP